MDMYKTVPNATFGDGKQWLKVLQHFNIMIKHRKRSINEIMGFLSWPPTIELILFVWFQQFGFNALKEAYPQCPNFVQIYVVLPNSMINGSTTTWGRIEFYTDLTLFAFLREMTNYNLLRKVHYSIILGNFGVEKVIVDLKRHLFLPRLAKMVAMFVKSCSLCSILNPTIQKLRKYIPPLVLGR